MSAASFTVEGEPNRGPGGMIHSGIAPLDEQLGGIAAGRIHLLSGGIGAGKTTACLQFLAAGLQRGERAAILTLDEPSELAAHATFLGIDLAGPVRRGQLAALRFRSAFSRRLAAVGSYGRLLDDLHGMMGSDAPPARIVIDPLSPFLPDGPPAGGGIAALVELLERLAATALLTLGRPLTPTGADRRLDPLIDRAATISSVERCPDGSHQMLVSRARLVGAPAGPLSFPIGAAAGRTASHERPRLGPARSTPRPVSHHHRLIVVAAHETELPEDALALLRSEYEIRIDRSVPAARGPHAGDDVSAVVIAADRQSLARAHDMLLQVAESRHAPAILVMLSGHHRSQDRARLLRGGADEVLPWDVGPQELLQKVGRALARGHTPPTPGRPAPQAEATVGLHGSAAPGMPAALTDALTARPPLEPHARWAVLVLTPRQRSGKDVLGWSARAETLQGIVLTAIRSADSDRAAAVDDSVAAYLHEATEGDAEAVAARIRGLWRAGKHGPLRVQILTDRSAEAAALPAPASRKMS